MFLTKLNKLPRFTAGERFTVQREVRDRETGMVYNAKTTTTAAATTTTTTTT